MDTSLEWFKEIIKLVDVIIWPLIVFCFVLMFRPYFAQAFKRLGSIQAGATGIAMTFDKKIDETKALLKQIRPKDQSKSASRRLSSSTQSDEQLGLNQIEIGVEQHLQALAEQNEVDVNGLNTLEINTKLKDRGIILLQKKKLIDHLIDLLKTPHGDLNNEQLQVINDLYRTAVAK
ncbi:hypothetical protein [Croceiramulus getboli]|nr:hypothetical protein P8624_11990 [Flavobacteriaceae bacterium YJPT1-3]